MKKMVKGCRYLRTEIYMLENMNLVHLKDMENIIGVMGLCIEDSFSQE